MPNREAYVQRMKIQLDELNAGIDKMEGKAQVGEVRILTARQKEVNMLRSQSQKALLKLDEITHSGDGGWENLKSEMEKARDALAYSVHDAKSRS